jgi:hypothetical protein
MEEKFAELKRNRSQKLAKAERRAMELNSLRIHQPNELEPSVPMVEGGASGLSRLRGTPHKKGGFFGPLLASIAAPLAVSAVRKITGLGKMGQMKGGAYVDKQFGIINDPKPPSAEEVQGVARPAPMEGYGYKKQGKKSREDEKLAMEIAHMKGKGRAGAGRAGAGKSGDKRKARGDAIRKLMKQHGMTLPQASKHLKENGY